MTQQGPNVVELYEAAVQQMLPTLGAVTADQLTNATPCVEWNVQNVIIHNIKVADYVQGIIQGCRCPGKMSGFSVQGKCQ